MIHVNIKNNQVTETFGELEIGKFFVYRNQLFIKVGEARDFVKNTDPTSAINVQSGEEWVMENGEMVQRPCDISIEVTL